MFVYISASINRNASVLSPTSAYNSFKKMKKTPECTSVLEVFLTFFFFLRQVFCILKGTLEQDDP